MKNIYLYVSIEARNVITNQEAQVSSGIALDEETKDYEDIVPGMLKEIEKKTGQKGWEEGIITSLNELSEEAYFRLFPYCRPGFKWEMTKEEGDQDLFKAIESIKMSRTLRKILQHELRWKNNVFDKYSCKKLKTVKDLVTLNKEQFQKGSKAGKEFMDELDNIMKSMGWHWKMKVEP